MGEHSLPQEVVDHCLGHLPLDSLAICLLVSRLFWKLSRPLVFRELHVKLRLLGRAPREVYRDIRRLGRVKHLIHSDDAHYSVRPLVRSLVLQIELGTHIFPTIEAGLLMVIELLLHRDTKLSCLFLTLDGHSTAGPQRLPLKNGLIRLIQQPTLRHLYIFLMPDLPIDIFNNLNLGSLDLGGCSTAPSRQQLVALPLKRFRTDHTFPVFEIYSKASTQTADEDPPPQPYTSLECYEAETHPYELPSDFAIARQSFRTLQVLSFVIEGI